MPRFCLNVIRAWLLAVACVWAPAALAQGDLPNLTGALMLPEQAAAGEEAVLHLSLTAPEGWHHYGEGVKVGMPSRLVLPEQAALDWGDPVWAEATPHDGEPYYHGTIQVTVPFTPHEAGALPLAITVKYMLCDDANTRCTPPRQLVLEGALDVALGSENADAAHQVPDVAQDGLAQSSPAGEGGEGAKPADMSSEQARDAVIDFFGTPIALTSPTGLAAVVVLGLLGGFILNFMPCVLPVIPLKIMGLVSTQCSHARHVFLGGMMWLGVLLFWLAIGIAIASVQGFDGPAQLIGTWWFSLAIGVFIVVMGIGMLGIWHVALPQWVYRVQPSHDSTHGALGFGVMTAILALPCTGPFLGPVIGATAAGGQTWITLLTFFSVGLGMGAPYFVLVMFPKLIERLPRAGASSDLLKQVLGILAMAAGLFFMRGGVSSLIKGWPDRFAQSSLENGLLEAEGQEAFTSGAFQIAEAVSVLMWWPVGLVAAGAGLWLAWRAQRIGLRPVGRGVSSVLGVVMLASGIWVVSALGKVSEEQGVWRRYVSDEVLAGYLERGDAVLLDFTADWCINCKTLEKTVLDTAQGQVQLTRPGVVAVKVDLSNPNFEAGWNLLRERAGRRTIPQLVLLTPDGEVSWVAPIPYTTEQIRQALDAAGVPEPAAP